jgi:hypothetical protein
VAKKDRTFSFSSLYLFILFSESKILRYQKLVDEAEKVGLVYACTPDPVGLSVLLLSLK